MSAMDMMTRRRAMMGSGPAPDTGIEYYNFGNVIFKNNRSSTTSVSVLAYSSSVTFYPNAQTNITVGSTSSRDALTDGTYFWVSLSTGSASIKYNNVSVINAHSGGNYRIKIPNNFDPTIPFEIS